MIKTLSLLLVTIITVKAYAQDSLQLFYISKISLTRSDSADLAHCKKTEYKSVSLEVNLYSRSGATETIYTSGKDYRWWKDSVFFSYHVPAAMYKQTDSIVIRPTFHVACAGLNGNRGIENMDAEGKEKTIRNIILKFLSNPAGANVYLIPKMVWERTPGLYGKNKNELLLGHYAIYNGTTPVQSTAQEYVYIALFKLNNLFVPVECSPTHFTPVDSVYANFPKR